MSHNQKVVTLLYLPHSSSLLLQVQTHFICISRFVCFRGPITWHELLSTPNTASNSRTTQLESRFYRGFPRYARPQAIHIWQNKNITTHVNHFCLTLTLHIYVFFHRTTRQKPIFQRCIEASVATNDHVASLFYFNLPNTYDRHTQNYLR